MSQPAASLTPAVFALLLALADGKRHGYALVQDVREISDGNIRLGYGTLYRSLQRMRVDGLIEELDATTQTEEQAEAPADGRAQRRRSYRITPAGRRAAAAEASRLAVLVTAAHRRGLLEDLGDTRGGHER